MVNRITTCLSVCALAVAAGCAAPESAPATRALDSLRGGDLYRTACIACHTAQVHWRDKRLVKSWDDLLFQVSRWQRVSGQDWSLEEIDDVAAYLNSLFYDVPCPQVGCGSSTSPLKRS